MSEQIKLQILFKKIQFVGLLMAAMHVKTANIRKRTYYTIVNHLSINVLLSSITFF